MATTTKKKALGSAILMGAFSIGMYALLPIATAFLFSFVHGSFTSNFWTAFGIEAAKSKGGK